MRAKEPIGTLWHCPTCGMNKPGEDYYADKRSPNGLKSQCKKCHTESAIRTRDKELHRANRRKSAARTREKNPDKYRARERNAPRRTGAKVDARRKLNLEVRKGTIVKPVICEDCGQCMRLTAHHEDYKRPLDVHWLCYLCHARRHRK